MQRNAKLPLCAVQSVSRSKAVYSSSEHLCNRFLARTRLSRASLLHATRTCELTAHRAIARWAGAHLMLFLVSNDVRKSSFFIRSHYFFLFDRCIWSKFLFSMVEPLKTSLWSRLQWERERGFEALANEKKMNMTNEHVKQTSHTSNLPPTSRINIRCIVERQVNDQIGFHAEREVGFHLEKKNRSISQRRDAIIVPFQTHTHSHSQNIKSHRTHGTRKLHARELSR